MSTSHAGRWFASASSLLMVKLVIDEDGSRLKASSRVDTGWRASSPFFGHISDIAGGIAEMCNSPAKVREKIGALVAVGNIIGSFRQGFRHWICSTCFVGIVQCFRRSPASHIRRHYARRAGPYNNFTLVHRLDDPILFFSTFDEAVLTGSIENQA